MTAERVSSEELDVLWEPVRINELELKNRIFVSAHMMAMNDENIVGDRYIAYYEARARGGAGLLITGAEGVDRSGWKRPYFQAWREDAEPRYRALAEAVHRHDSRIFTQLWHGGLQTVGIGELDQQFPPYGPSGVFSPAGGRIAKALEKPEIDEIIKAFATTAALEQAAGIDGVEVSAAHGYLLSNFLSPHSNLREDEYGGSVENRCRLAIEVGQAIRREVGSGFPVGLRLTFDEFIGPGGSTPDDSELLLAELHRHGIFDYFSVSGGTYHSLWSTITPMTNRPEQPYLDNGARARRIVDGAVPVAVSSGLRTVELAAEAVRAGQADLVAMTRAHIADPEIVNKVRAGRGSSVQRCVGANQGCVMRQAMGYMSSCTVNPAVGREKAFEEGDAPAERKRKVVVVGGGPGGLKAADSLARRGHDVTLFEAEDRLGGGMIRAGALPRRERWLEGLDDMVRAVNDAGVDVRLGSRATKEGILSEQPDLVVLAVGAEFDKSGYSVLRPDRSTIDGLESAEVVSPWEVANGYDLASRDVVIVDDFGDQAGVGVAMLLGEAGNRVHVVTMAPFVGAAAATTLDVPGVTYPLLAQAGVTLHPNTTLQQVADGQAMLVDVYSGKVTEVAADVIVLNMLRKPREEIYLALKEEGVPMVRVGDCLAPRYIDEAIYEGALVALDIEETIADPQFSVVNS